jgi:hypothetical protein
MAHTINPHQADQAGTSALFKAKPTPAHQGDKKTRHSPRFARLLAALLEAQGSAIDGMELGRMAGAANVWDLVMRAKRKHGVTITTTSRKHIDRDGRTVKVGQYAIAGDRAQAKAREVLAVLTGEG